MADRSFHRPRDIIQFTKKIQLQAIKTNTLNCYTVKDAEKEYSLWFLSELENELGPKINKMDHLYEFLRLFGKNHFSLYNFKMKYNKYKDIFNYEPEDIVHLLYDTGILINIDVRKRPYEMFSIIRNERSKFNRDLQLVLHRGFWEGLTTTRLMKKT